MAQKIPFFNMFADLLPPPDLKIRLGGAVITGAVIDQNSFLMELQITTRQLLTAEDIDILQKIIAATYGFSAVKIQAESPAGAFYAIQTLRQILKEETVPCLHIKDRPDFKYRGFYQDVTRGKIPTVATLKKLIDDMAYYKLSFLI